MKPYDAEEHCNLGLASGRWAVEELGDKVQLTTLYICRGDGRLHHIEMGRESETEERWRGISLVYWYLAITGTYMRRKWISPFDLYES